MAQFAIGDLQSPTSGAALIDGNLEPQQEALLTSHSGGTRPSYAQQGTVWLDTSGTPWSWKMFDGSDDIVIGTFNATTNIFTPANVSGAWMGTAGGTGNALTLTPSPAIAAYNTGAPFDFLISAANTSPTVNVNISTLGNKRLKIWNGMAKVDPPNGFLQSGMVARGIYDGTDVLVTNVRPYNQGADVASASTINLDNATGDYVHITGTTTVTAITLGQGQERTCVADAAFTLTDGSNLICIGGANITTAAGDTFVVRGEASGVVRMISYTKADGTPLVTGGAGALVFLASVTASGSAFMDFTSLIDSTYDEYIFELVDIRSSTSQDVLQMRTSSNNGVSFASSSSDYAFGLTQITGASSAVVDQSNGLVGSVAITLTYGVPLSSGGCSGTVKLYSPSNTTLGKVVNYQLSSYQGGSNMNSVGAGSRQSTSAINAVRFLFYSGGNFTDGTIRMYGVSKS